MDTDIVIAGGGIIGLSTALELRRRGFKVRVIERGQVMSEASWAAAGMLAVEDPENPPELDALARLSGDLYPEYLRRIQELSGIAVPLRTRGTLQATRRGAAFHRGAGATRAAMSSREAERRVPGLAPDARSFLWLEEASLDPRDLCRALPRAAVAAGVAIEERTSILAFQEKSGSVEITTSAGGRSAGAFVNCCGAWAAGVMEDPSLNAVMPRKGQMVMVRLEAPPKLEHVLRTPDVYLVPRGDGRVVIGATVECVGFDREVDPAALEGLRGLAAELWPPIAAAPMIDQWAGLRPGTNDGLPVIGRSATPNCWVAAGHFRNGILLAPATAVVMRQSIEGSAPGVPIGAFRVQRLKAQSSA